MKGEGRDVARVENTERDRIASLAVVVSNLEYIGRNSAISVVEVRLDLSSAVLSLVLSYPHGASGWVRVERVYHLDLLAAPRMGATCCDYLSETADDLMTFPIEALADPGRIYVLHIPKDYEQRM